MLPPVNASIPTQPVTTSAIGQREARSDGATAVGLAQKGAVPAEQTALPQGAASETLQSLRQLADLLGSQQVDAEDILTRLAIDFADALGDAPLPDETPRDFANRLASTILKMPEAARTAAAGNSNLAQLNIPVAAFAEALADPASPAAARIVAMAEDPGAEGLKQMLNAAIESYEQNGETAPATTATPKPAAQPNSEAGAAAQKSATAEAGSHAAPAEAGAGDIRKPAAQAAAPEAAAPRPATTTPHAEFSATMQPPARAATPAQVAETIAAQPKAQTAATSAAQMATAARMDADEGQPTMQVLRGFNVVVANVATRAADVLKTVAAIAQQAETSQTFAPAGTALAETARATRSTPAEPALPARVIDAEPAPVIAGKAHEAVRAMEGKVIPLFARATAGEEVDNIDIDHLIRMAQQSTAKPDPTRLPEAALVQARQAEGVPFAQVPYPFVREDEEKRRRRGFGEQAEGGDGEEMTGEDGQSLWHGDGEQPEHHEQPEIDEHPFDAEEPLKRNPSDAERALHMYQRFGGF